MMLAQNKFFAHRRMEQSIKLNSDGVVTLYKDWHVIEMAHCPVVIAGARPAVS